MKTQTTGKKKKQEFVLPDLKTVKADDDGYKSISTVFDSSFKTFEKEGDVFIGKFIEVLEAGKKGQEKPCALFEEKETGAKFLLGNYQVMQAVENYGVAEYRIIFKGKKKTKSGQKVATFEIAVKELKSKKS